MQFHNDGTNTRYNTTAGHQTRQVMSEKFIFLQRYSLRAFFIVIRLF